jgi:hypothetical protein
METPGRENGTRPRGLSIGWILAAMAWFAVFQQPVWVGALSGAALGLVRTWLLPRRAGCLGCLASSMWAWALALLGGIVWVARAI